MKDERHPYVAPSIERGDFNCPYCRAFAHQKWYSCQTAKLAADEIPSFEGHKKTAVYLEKIKTSSEPQLKPAKARERVLSALVAGEPVFSGTQSDAGILVSNLHFSQCQACNRVAVWVYRRLVWPEQVDGPDPSEYLPTDIAKDYSEAAAIAGRSPRSAAALLRLALQKLCRELGQPGKNIYDDIGRLVAEGLPEFVQQAMDVVRHTGNEAVHPSGADLEREEEATAILFELLNLIADEKIGKAARVARAYDRLPKTVKEKIDERNARAKKKVDK